MGNIRGWSGPLSKSYRYLQMLLQQQIIKAQRDLGMSVALPSFAGHVPVGLAQRFPAVNFTSVDRWNNFPNKYCCSLFLEPNEQLFTEIASMFLRATIKLYGTDHIYFCDPFNEIQPKIDDPNYINMTAYNIYNAINTIDPHGIWLLQGWMFVNKFVFWTDPLIKAFLTAVPTGRMLVLDLQSEQFPQYERTHSFYGQPFIWCMLHNFGGTLGMHGSVRTINSNIRLARNMENSTMVGVGIAPEGIHQNYVMYSLTLERAWMKVDFDLSSWFSTYSNVRYEVKDYLLQNAWLLLKDSVYSYYGLIKMHGGYTITRRPSLNHNPWIWYNSSSILKSWKYFLSANLSTVEGGNLANYNNDLVDINRQYLQILADKAYVNLVAAYKERAQLRFNFAVYIFKEVLQDLEQILATNKNFLLGRWIESAKKLANYPSERRLFEMNARNQITSWGPNGQIVDCATKQWSGIIKDYYAPRWELFFNWLNATLVQNTKFNEKIFQNVVNRDIELPFTVASTTYRVHGNGDTLNVSHKLFNKWKYLAKCNEFKMYLHIKLRKIKLA